jgi:hypothetical protein
MTRKLTAMLVVSSFSLPLLPSTAGADAKAPPAPIAGKIPLGLTITETELVTTGWRGSKLISADVRNDKGESIGKVDDVIVAPNGSLSVVVIEVGGFLGIGGHLVAIPMRELRLSPTEPKLTPPGASKAALKALPEFKYAS